MNDIEDKQKILEAIDSWNASIQTLKSFNVIRSQKWVADYGEWLVKMLFDGILATSKTQEGWDVEINEHKVQVRTSFIPQTGSEYTRCSINKDFDELIVVGLTNNMRIGKLFKIAKKDLEPLIRNGKEPRVNWCDLEKYLVDISSCTSKNNMAQFLEQPTNSEKH